MKQRLAVLAFLGLASIPAFGATIYHDGHEAIQVGTFTCVNLTGPNCDSTTFAQFQLWVDPLSTVLELGILNAGPVASSLHEIYFDKGITTFASGIDSYSIAGSSYGPTGGRYDFPNGSPSNLPGGPLSFTSDFMLDANPPTATNGLHPGEAMWVQFTSPLTLTTPAILASAYTQLLLDLNGGVNGLRVGIHVGGFPFGNSPDGISTCVVCTSGDPPIDDAPEPGTWAMLAGGIAMLGLRRWKLRKF